MDDVDAMDGRGQAMDGGRRRTATERRDYKGEESPPYTFLRNEPTVFWPDFYCK